MGGCIWELHEEGTAEGALLALLPVPGRLYVPYMLGRAEAADLRLENDKSVSRSHLTLRISVDQTSLIAADVSARFGTLVDGKRLEPKGELALGGPEHMLQLGTKRIRVRRLPLSLCFSGLARPAIDALQAATAKMGVGAVSKEWTEGTTHLVMDTFKVTPKLLNALAQCCPIVTMQWVTAAAARTSPTQPLPLTDGDGVVAGHKPTVPVTLKISPDCLRVEPKRRTLFRERRFVYLPGGESTARDQNRQHLLAMGAEEVVDLASMDPATLAKHVATGFEFLVPEGVVNATELVDRVGAVGGRTFGASIVRICLLQVSASFLTPMSTSSTSISAQSTQSGHAPGPAPVLGQVEGERPASAVGGPAPMPAAGVAPYAASQVGVSVASASHNHARVETRCQQGVTASPPSEPLAPEAAAVSNSDCAHPERSRDTLVDRHPRPAGATKTINAIGSCSPATSCATPPLRDGWRVRPHAQGGGEDFLRDGSSASAEHMEMPTSFVEINQRPGPGANASGLTDKRDFRRTNLRKKRAVVGTMVQVVDDGAEWHQGAERRAGYDDQATVNEADELFDEATSRAPHKRSRR